MKKVASFALAAALTASLAVSAGAVGIGHYEDCADYNSAVLNGAPGYTKPVFAPNSTAATVAHYTTVQLPRGAASSYTSHKEAITAKELEQACEAAGVKNLTVFKQRNVKDVAGTVNFRLWTVGKKNSVVVLTRAEGETAWTVAAVGEAGEKWVNNVPVPANGAYAVCMAW